MVSKISPIRQTKRLCYSAGRCYA